MADTSDNRKEMYGFKNTFSDICYWKKSEQYVYVKNCSVLAISLEKLLLSIARKRSLLWAAFLITVRKLLACV